MLRKINRQPITTVDHEKLYDADTLKFLIKPPKFQLRYG